MSEKDLRAEISELRRDGCMKAGEHEKGMSMVEATVKQHDKRINETEKSVIEINTKLDALPGQVVKELNGDLKPPRTLIPVKIKPLGIETKIPATWLGWAAVFIILGFVTWANLAGKQQVQDTLQNWKPEFHVSTNGLVISTGAGKRGP